MTLQAFQIGLKQQLEQRLLKPAFCAVVTISAALTAFPAHADTAYESGLLVAASTATKKTTSTRPAPDESSLAARANAPFVTVKSTGPGQAGYIHYFVITGPDNEPESHVGIELPGDRIAWSFPETGVAVVSFARSGSITANGKTYAFEHLYGIRPFPDERSMETLQTALAARVAYWVAEKTPYCDEQGDTGRMCVSCLGFVLRVLYPGSTPLLPALPADFKSVRKFTYTTEDLLLYLAGVPLNASPEARMKRIESLTVPADMREQLVRLTGEVDAATPAVTAAAPAPNPTAVKPRGRSLADVPKRVLSRRRS
ncbi:MAG TPA: hypothetical protein VM164_09285 [Burkholderiales bacterium]|nr:hypothetical protein [Burkholderiales bacterium]